MLINSWLKDFLSEGEQPAVVFRGFFYSYEEIHHKVQYFYRDMIAREIPEGSLVWIGSDISPNKIALLLALMQHNCIAILSDECLSSVSADYVAKLKCGVIEYKARENKRICCEVEQLQALNRPGVITRQKGKVIIEDVAVMLNQISKTTDFIGSTSFACLVDMVRLMMAFYHKQSIIINNDVVSQVYDHQVYALAA